MPNEATRIPVGDKLYFWKHPEAPHRCIVSCHAIRRTGTRRFRTSSIRNNIVLYFYCPDNFGLINMGIDNMPMRPFLSVSPDQPVYEYALWKFQDNTTFAAESYDSISRYIQRYNRNRTFLRSRDLQPSNSPLWRRRLTPPRRSDCFSVVAARVSERNMISLSGVLRAISHTQNVNEFHCLICRNNINEPGYSALANLWDASLN